MFKKWLSLLMAVVMLTAVSAFAEVKVTDVNGTEWVFDKPIERVVVLMPSDAEILYELGAGDLIVGRGKYVDYPEAVQQIEALETGKNLNLEQIVALKPDVVIMGMMGHTEEQVKALNDAGLKTVISHSQTIEDVYACINMLGGLVSKQEEAVALVDGMKAAFAAVVEKVGGRKAGTVYFEVSPLQYGLYTAGKGTFMNEMAELLGLTNVFGDLEGWKSVSEEQVIALNPDFIVTTTMYMGEGPKPEEEVMGREGWKDVTAIKEGRVLNADNNEITRPGPRLVKAIEQLYTFAYEGAK